jgi:hypothetical protein
MPGGAPSGLGLPGTSHPAGPGAGLRPALSAPRQQLRESCLHCGPWWPRPAFLQSVVSLRPVRSTCGCGRGLGPSLRWTRVGRPAGQRCCVRRCAGTSASEPGGADRGFNAPPVVADCVSQPLPRPCSVLFFLRSTGSGHVLKSARV